MIFVSGILIDNLFRFIYINWSKININKYYLLAKNIIINAIMWFYSLTPFSKSILKNPQFKYVFTIGTIISVLVIIIFTIFLKYESNKSIISIILYSIVVAFIYIYINFGICHIIIKIPIWFKFLSTIAIIIFNLICIRLLGWITEKLNIIEVEDYIS